MILTHQRASIFRALLLAWTACALVWGALCLSAPSAFAQDDLDKLIKSNTSNRDTTPTGADGKLKGPTVERVQLDVKWGLRRAANDPETKDRLFNEYLEIIRELGDPNRPNESLALIQEGQQAIKQNNRTLAAKRFQQAQLLSPDFPAPAFAQLNNAFAANPADFTSILEFTESGYTRALKHTLPTRLELQTNTVHTLSIALFILLAVFSVALLIRALPFLASDTLRFLPKGIAPFQAMLAWLLVLTIPILILNSPILSFILLTVVLAMYMRWSERVVAAALLFALSALPTTAEHTTPGISWNASSVQTLWKASYTHCDAECTETLSKPLPGEKTLPALTHARTFLQHTVDLRQQPIQRAKEIETGLLGLTSKLDASPPTQSALYTNIGIAQAITGKLDQAEASLKKAATLQPKNPYAHLNLSRIYELQDNGTAQQNSLKTALDLEKNLISKRSQINNRTVAAWFTLAQLPTSTLYSVLQQENTQPALLSVWRPLLGSLPTQSLQPLGMAALGLLGLFSLVAIPFRAARACPRCDTPTSTKSPEPITQRGDTCGMCNALDRRAIKAYHQRTRHEAQINRAESVRPLLFRGGNLLFPGLGGTLLGHASGIFLIAAACIGLGFLGSFDPPLARSWNLGMITREPSAWVFFITAVPAWAISLLWGILGKAQPPKLPRDPNAPKPAASSKGTPSP